MPDALSAIEIADLFSGAASHPSAHAALRHAGRDDAMGYQGGPPGSGAAAIGSAPDLIAALSAHLGVVMAAALGASPAYPKVYFDAAPPWSGPGDGFPYIVAHDPDAHDRFDSTGTRISHGHLVFNVKAKGKSQARAIGNRLIATLTDAELGFDEGTLLYLRPVSEHSAPIIQQAPTGAGPGSGPPVATERVVVFEYLIRYPPPA